VSAAAAWDHPAVGAQEMRTKRLRLTRPMATDSAGVFAILGDPRTVEHNPSDRLEDRGEAAELVARWVRHWEEHGFGYWCVRESGSDRIIGYAGVKRMLMHGRPVLNLVYRFVPEVWGRGFATEAARAVVSRALDQMPAETIVARVRPDNRSSQNVALKAGLQRDATMDCQREDGLDCCQRSSPQLAMTTAIGGSTAATTDMATAAVVDHSRTRFQASRINTRQTPIRAKYHRRRRRRRSLCGLRTPLAVTRWFRLIAATFPRWPSGCGGRNELADRKIPVSSSRRNDAG
jgi:RimJ/RimL family protein N-acetyltransferase